MPVIRVSDEVMAILKEFAVPLQDTPDSVLRRILREYLRLKQGTNDELSPTSSVPKTMTSLGKSNQRYAPWIMASLQAHGGRASAQELMATIEKLFGHEFSGEEREPLKSGHPRWRKKVYAARGDLIRHGFLKKTRYGIWEIT
jgi:hypothetical protein